MLKFSWNCWKCQRLYLFLSICWIFNNWQLNYVNWCCIFWPAIGPCSAKISHPLHLLNMSQKVYYGYQITESFHFYQYPDLRPYNNKKVQHGSVSSRGGLGGKATTIFKRSCHFSPGGSNPAWGINTVDYAPAVIWPFLDCCIQIPMPPDCVVVICEGWQIFQIKLRRDKGCMEDRSKDRSLNGTMKHIKEQQVFTIYASVIWMIFQPDLNQLHKIIQESNQPQPL